MLPQTILLPGNMCDLRLWRGGDEVIIKTLSDHRLSPVFYADLTQDNNIAAMAERALSATQGPLLPIGFSMGAIVAVEMAVRAPERVAGLVLAGYNATADLPERAAHRPVQQAEVRAGGMERVLVEELKPNSLAVPTRRCWNCCATWGWALARMYSSVKARRCVCAKIDALCLPHLIFQCFICAAQKMRYAHPLGIATGRIRPAMPVLKKFPTQAIWCRLKRPPSSLKYSIIGSHKIERNLPDG